MATIFTDNFNTYTDGELVGQGGWSGTSGYWLVEVPYVAEGEKGICCSIANTGWSVEKTGTPLTDGKVAFYTKLAGFPSSYFIFRISSAAVSPTYVDIRFDSAHNITLLGSTTIQAYSVATWYGVEVEWRSTPDYRFRARVNGGSWSTWVSGYLSREWTTGLTKISLIKNSTGTDSYYLDYIAEEPIDPPNTTIIEHPRVITKLTSGTFTFTSDLSDDVTYETNLDSAGWEPVEIFFDTLDDNYLDPNKWSSGELLPWPGLVEQNGHLEYNGGHAQLVIQAVIAVSSSGVPFSPAVIGNEVIWKMSSYDVSWTGIIGSSFRVSDFDHSTSVGLDIGDNQWEYLYELGIYTDFDVTPPTLVNNQVYECKIKFISSTCVEYYIDGVLVKTSNPAIPFTLETPLYGFASCGYCKFNDFIFQKITPTKSYTGLSDATHNFKVRAINQIGVSDPTPAEYDWTVDTISPSSIIVIHPADPSLADVHFEFSSNEVSSTFETKLDDGEWKGTNFFDKFDDNYLDLSKWTDYPPYLALVEQNNCLQGTTPGTPQIVIAVTGSPSDVYQFNPIGKEFSIKIGFTSFAGFTGCLVAIDQYPDMNVQCGIGAGAMHVGIPPSWEIRFHNMAHYPTIPFPVVELGVFYTWTIKFISATHIEWWMDGICYLSLNPPEAGRELDIDNALFYITTSYFGQFEDFTLKDSDYDPTSKEKDYTDLSDGEHTFYVRATDPAGNTDSNPPSYTWHVDNSPYIDLNWTDTSANETQFRVERKEEVGGTWGLLGIVSADVTSYHDTDIVSGVDYYYRVYAHNSAGDSTYSNEASGAVPT